MAYEKQNFQDGQILTAKHLNHMEDGIEAASRLSEEEKAEIVDMVFKAICESLGK